LGEKICPNDSRFRPDLKAWENGQVEQAKFLKNKLEEEQRARRKELEKKKESHIPKYFELKKFEGTDLEIWQPNGLYWKDREEGKWDRIIKVFNN
jgi:hypothetical protein